MGLIPVQLSRFAALSPLGAFQSVKPWRLADVLGKPQAGRD